MRSDRALCTRRAYASGWKAFCAWCAEARRSSLPADPKTVRNFAVWCINEKYRLATVLVRLNAIAHYHREADFASPIDKSVRNLLTRARRDLKEVPRKKAALTYDNLCRVLRTIPNTRIGIRNRAMLTLTFAGGFRRSEVVALQLADLQFVPQGMTIYVASSKTDQTAQGAIVGIEPGKRLLTCPVRALEKWLEIRGKWQGPLFVRMTPHQTITGHALHERGEVIHTMLKRALEKIGENAADYGAHSLRAGMITEAARHGASEVAIKSRTRHKCSAVLQGYIRPATVFEFNPLKAVL
ncbi:MAG TPA: tyrosine-type recombinase/integrase [Bryobacteraceae bacterium]|jgi:integrase|nr:tyrosine-type recombinase/integrase [Bryobacteraceae bacterium]